MKPRVDCSIHLETACAAHQNEGEQIYDYLLVLAADCDAHYVEVHPASSTGTVQEMIHKKKGTAAILGRMGVRPDGTWHWIVPSKGKVCFKASDAYGKRLAAAGIRQPRRAL
ncbi:MAG: hypothetical protein D6731_13015 [Planctomycetota bacterium]|nr:MAG: hypothetical protein D6731_13015 [Planctomycetota bacterium]